MSAEARSGFLSLADARKAIDKRVAEQRTVDEEKANQLMMILAPAQKQAVDRGSTEFTHYEDCLDITAGTISALERRLQAFGFALRCSTDCERTTFYVQELQDQQ